MANSDSKNRRRLIIGLLLLVVVVGGLKFAAAQLNSSSSGQVNVGQPKAGSDSFNIDLTPTPYRGKTVSFDYPKGLHSKASNPLVGPDVEKASFTAKDLETWNLEIDVTNDGAKPLSGNASYSFRTQNPQTYQLSTVSYNGQLVPVMTDKTAAGFAKVAFLTHGGERATVSLIGNDADGVTPLQTSFNMVLSSWHWN